MDSTHQRDEADKLLQPGEAAEMFGVSTKTLCRWHKLGLISARRTLGGQRRYWASEVRNLASATEAVA